MGIISYSSNKGIRARWDFLMEAVVVRQEEYDACFFTKTKEVYFRISRREE